MNADEKPERRPPARRDTQDSHKLPNQGRGMNGKGIIPLPIIPLPLQLSAQKNFLTEGNEGNEGRLELRFQVRLKRSARFWSAAALCRLVRPQQCKDEQSGGGPPHSRTLARSSMGPRVSERFL